ncbi:hypothetical protein JCGZ_00409 [Jatropha curcas]|uniref:FHA domain-containing protein n=1 Tax=Jatropha curcas TaxID=180498 RepID=A0A067JG58_JATCU|nr:uncharacterized protein LOC105648085 isoform X2 [Jatropha curcas]KDP22822.1 hypothetical protein JCGZ_00409 [Jatropha curcas]
MEMTAQSLSHASVSPPIFHNSKPYFFAHKSIPFHSPNTISTHLQFVRIRARKQRNLGPINVSESETTFTQLQQDRWLLEPAGDGDSRHIGFKVNMPDAFEIVSSEVTVGRLADKADVVIPVATVSGVHARIEKKGGNLLITDLDSTNGTFINEKKLIPGVAASVPPGSFITFGDIHLAMFRVKKLENVEAASNPEPEESKQKAETSSSPVESNETS